MSTLKQVSHAMFDRWQAFSESGAVLPVLFAWAALEATVWPILADFLLAPVALVRRSRMWAPLAAVVAGMSLGGIVTVLVAHWWPALGLELLRDLPLVSEAQVQGASRGLIEHRAGGFLIQPWSGIPFKVWAGMAGVHDIGPALVIPTFIVARSARMLAIATIAFALGRPLRALLRDWFALVAALYVIVFTVSFAWIVG